MDHQSSHTWIDVALTAIATLPAVIAAASSLRNGRTLRNGAAPTSAEKRRVRTAGNKSKADSGHPGKPKSEDWYKPPDLS